jgi:hypothetical protein
VQFRIGEFGADAGHDQADFFDGVVLTKYYFCFSLIFGGKGDVSEGGTTHENTGERGEGEGWDAREHMFELKGADLFQAGVFGPGADWDLRGEGEIVVSLEIGWKFVSSSREYFATSCKFFCVLVLGFPTNC